MSEESLVNNVDNLFFSLAPWWERVRVRGILIFIVIWCGLSNMKVYYKIYDDIENAINQEKQIKSWPRSKKIELINIFNPFWDDLYEKL